ncbi:MAG: 4-(cytidine 5'-diphospho)-2-C-methyl-D-erythritol kinase [Dehalococcoidales bacterium]|nr:4-(cytidine 5'-diphospho)-2-C-methyl-D-erythritol kinase [Dehalococcoidales bacterium]
MLTLSAPAKINLTLEVLGKRADGYHEIRSVLQTITLCDRLTFAQDSRLTISSNLSEWNAGQSLVSKAVALLQNYTGTKHGASINVEKHIPLVAGLGGDSSDAATTLRALNGLWDLKLPNTRLLELAAQLGSDVSFFLYGGTALAEGRGEKLTPLPPLPHLWIMLVVPRIPPIPNKTARLYASLKPNHFTDGKITQRLVDTLKASKKFDNSLLFNTFENVAFTRFAELDTYRKHLIKLGAKDVHLAGSGPTLFTLLEGEAQARDLFTRCHNQGMETYLAETGEVIW